MVAFTQFPLPAALNCAGKRYELETIAVMGHGTIFMDSVLQSLVLELIKSLGEV